MNKAENILKNAFTDAYSLPLEEYSHSFSKEFEKRISTLIKSQKSILRLVNTTGKKVASVVLALLIITASTVFGVSAIRKPVVKAIKEFYTNAKEILSGGKADNISEYFSSEITRIVGTSYYSQPNNIYVINDTEEVSRFVTLLADTYWGEPEDFDYLEIDDYNYSFEFFDKNDDSVLTIYMSTTIGLKNSRYAVISKDNEKYLYIISPRIYKEMLAFTNEKFYLHNSNLPLPPKEFCVNRFNEIYKNIDEEVIEDTGKAIRNAHYNMEEFLINNVSKLKEVNSIYWGYVKSGETFIDHITGYEDSYTSYSSIISDLVYVRDTLNDSHLKETIITAIKLWESSIENHDLYGLFKAHEYIHDYDYFTLNYPTKYVYSPYADYQGVDDYFGHLDSD